MENRSKLYGVVQGQEKISFVLDGFECVFFHTDPAPNTFTLLPHRQGFIVGRTAAQRYVYIYAHQDLKIWHELTLHTWGYIVSSSPDIQAYQILCFKGGILNKLFYQSSVKFEYTDADETKVQYRDDTLSYPFTGKKWKGRISVYSSPLERMSAEKGESIQTGGTCLEISFDGEKELQTFPEVFGYLLNLCQFMAFRRNVSFAEVAFLRPDDRFPEMTVSLADCHIHYEHTLNTEKPIHSCLTFNTLGQSVCGLLVSIMENTPKKPRFNIGFLPEDDKTVTYITGMKIREICSALESEMELANIQVQQEEAFDALVNRLKAVVTESRDGDHPLPDPKVYDYLFGTLRHLSGALSDRMEKCFLDCQPLLGEALSRRQIDELVKYRNTITHGSFMPLDPNLAETAYVLIKLVYCCVLKRIGMTDSTIRELFRWRLIS